MIPLFGYEFPLFQVFATVFGVGFIIFIHELGHFMMAKRFKIKVEQFAFGFGPEVVGYTYGETRYSICAIPLGGMIKMPGEDPEDSTGSPDEFMSQPWYRRLLIAVSGPLMNYVLAIFLFGIVFSAWGVSKPSDKAIVGTLVEGYPAIESGLESGDIIVSINNTPVTTWIEMTKIIHASPAASLAFEIKRDDSIMDINLTPKKDPVSGVGLIGITPVLKSEEVTFGNAMVMGVKMAYYQSVYTLAYLGEKLIKWEKPEVAGPMGVVQIIAKAAGSGWESLLHLLAIVSVALGLFNLLPIPLVDGGHIVMAIVEGIIRRPLSKKLIQSLNLAGFGFIIFVFIIATFNDLARLGISLDKFLK